MTVEIIVGDCRTALAGLAEKSVHCCVTSPPYFGLRDYGVAGQMGLENTPDEFVGALVEVFRAVRRVLRDDGTLWVNLGDSYNNADKWGGGGANTGKHTRAPDGSVESWKAVRRKWGGQADSKPKDMLGIPWMVAFALRADGWYLRRDIIWHKANPMPEAVRDRPTTAHEYIFLLSKAPKYFYDADAISEPVSGGAHARKPGINSLQNIDRVPISKKVGGVTPKSALPGQGIKANESFHAATGDLVETRNKRSVWMVGSEAFSEAHFATFPPALIEPCILAGCPPGGTVLDPFGGAGTTGLVADRLQRSAVLVELNPAYADMARRRIFNDAPLFAGVAE